MRDRLATKQANEFERTQNRKAAQDTFRSTIKDPMNATSSLIKPISDFGHASDVMNDALARYEAQVQAQN